MTPEAYSGVALHPCNCSCTQNAVWLLPGRSCSCAAWQPQVVPPIISMRDFDKVLDRARPTVSTKDLEVFERFTEEFGEEAS